MGRGRGRERERGGVKFRRGREEGSFGKITRRMMGTKMLCFWGTSDDGEFFSYHF